MNFHTDALGGRNANVCSAAAAQDRHGASDLVLSDAIILYRDRPDIVHEAHYPQENDFGSL
jgi:hypothetical protein